LSQVFALKSGTKLYVVISQKTVTLNLLY